MAAHVALYPLDYCTNGYDDKLSQFLVVAWWAQGLQMEKTLVGGGSLVELINGEIVSKMNPRPRIYKDSRVKVSLANEATTMYLERICQDFHQRPKI